MFVSRKKYDELKDEVNELTSEVRKLDLTVERRTEHCYKIEGIDKYKADKWETESLKARVDRLEKLLKVQFPNEQGMSIDLGDKVRIFEGGQVIEKKKAKKK